MFVDKGIRMLSSGGTHGWSCGGQEYVDAASSFNDVAAFFAHHDLSIRRRIASRK